MYVLIICELQDYLLSYAHNQIIIINSFQNINRSLNAPESDQNQVENGSQHLEEGDNIE